VGLQIAIRESGDVVILDLRGKLTFDGADSGLLRGQLQRLATNGVRKLLLNLTDLTQLDSSGVTIIVRTYFSLRSQGGDLRVLGAAGRVLDMFKVLHLLELLPSFEDESQALASFRPQSYSAKP
jgi:anti-sigma B factor antagonist